VAESHAYQLEGAIALLSPDEITPTAARVLQGIASQWRREAFEALREFDEALEETDHD
jgi:molybdopterin synthase catalytic subunit